MAHLATSQGSSYSFLMKRALRSNRVNEIIIKINHYKQEVRRYALWMPDGQRETQNQAVGHAVKQNCNEA